MAKTPKYDPAAIYLVQLTRPVELHGAQLIPSHTQRIKGSVLATLEPDAVGSATKQPPSLLSAGG